jgi:putrescine transport system ATP-binding protein
MTEQAAKTAPIVRFENVVKRFGDVTAVDGVSLDIQRGELFSLLGGSGCGKTTLLRMLAGFEIPTEGRILIDSVDVSTVPPHVRPVNMMFQSYALFPHMSVAGNIAFGLRQDQVPKAEIDTRVQEALQLVQLGGLGKRKPHQLSGGQRQRVALARSLIKRPKLLLLDEPLAALDKKLREKTQFELAHIQESVGITFVMVTHDQEEAMTLSDRLAVMDQGKIIQVGSPGEIYEYPNTRFSAEFIGSINLFEGVLTDDEQDHAIIQCPSPAVSLYLDRAVIGVEGSTQLIGIRPEKMAITKQALEPWPQHNCVRGTIDEIAYLGHFSTYIVRLEDGARLRVSAPNVDRHGDRELTWEDQVWVHWPDHAAVVLR